MKRFCSKIDADILEAVETAGGITPVGRMAKAGVWMLKRCHKQARHAVAEAAAARSAGRSGALKEGLHWKWSD
jgi:hypothetical protein